MTSHKVVVPDVGEGGMDVVFVQWHVTEGQFVNAGDELFELDTAKANVSVQASESGYVVGLSASPDDEVERGQVIATIADTLEGQPEEPGTERDEEESAPAGAPSESVVRPPQQSESPPPFASPKAKRLARERGVDLAAVAPGDGGWVTSAAVAAALESHDLIPSGAALSAPGTDSSVIRAARRRVMATSAMASWLQSPHASLSISLESRAGQRAATVDDLVVATSAALAASDGINVRWDGQTAIPRAGRNVGILWKTASGLIITRLTASSERSSVTQGVRSARERAERGVLLPDDHDERSITLMWIDTVEAMTGSSVLPHGDSAMLVAVASRTALSLTLTVDHRCIDLGTASEFLDTVAEALKERP